MMRRIFLIIVMTGLLLSGLRGYSQWKSFTLSPNGDTLNCEDQQGHKQGRWVNHVDALRGEPGYEEQGVYKDDKKEGTWQIFDLQGDLTGTEFYKWGNKDGVCQYFDMNGGLIREESWRALNPNKLYDTIQVPDPDHIDRMNTVIVKNEGVGIKDGVWKYYDPTTGMIDHTETYTLGKLEKGGSASATAAAPPGTVAKPKEVLEFEKKIGKKKVKVQDGSTSQ